MLVDVRTAEGGGTAIAGSLASMRLFSEPQPVMRETMQPQLSVVAPLYNESENVQPLVDWILEALGPYP
jgi:hypothetical protein